LTAGVCIIHLIRNTFRLASRRDWDALKRDLRPIYTAVNAEAARAALDDLADKWGSGIRRSSGSGATPERSSSRSWTTTSRSAR
jgi:transposase-like protein